MVVEVECVREDSSFLVLLPNNATNNESDDSVLLVGGPSSAPDVSVMSCRSNARDASTCPRDSSLEELRLTHNSILNVTEDSDDEDDDDDDDDERCSVQSFLFEEINATPDQSLLLHPEEDSGANTVTSTVLPADSVMRQQQQRPTPSSAVVACCSSRAGNAGTPSYDNAPQTNLMEWLDSSTTRLSESFSESFCPGRDDVEDERRNGDDEALATTTTDQLQHQLEMDILALLGCTESPTDDELAAWVTPLLVCPTEIYRQPTTSVNDNATRRPQRRNLRARAQRIHRLRQEQRRSSTSHITHSSDTASANALQTSQSVDDSMIMTLRNNSEVPETEVSFQETVASMLLLTVEDDLGKVIGNGIDPIPNLEPTLDGYDSDPEEFAHRGGEEEANLSSNNSNNSNDIFRTPGGLEGNILSKEAEVAVEQARSSDEIHQAVQESLNYVWTLTLHSSTDHPICVRVWMERGNILNCGRTIVEPKFMWRPMVESPSRKKANQPTTANSIRMLSACRICTLQDRKAYPWARPSRTVVIKTTACDDGQEYVFEAASEADRDAMMQQWKLVVARLASLAVLEDMEGLAREFFNPIHTSPLMVTFS